MAKKKEYEEKQQHGTAQLPVGVHKMSYPAGTDVIFYLHWHQEFEILIVTQGRMLFEIEDRKYLLEQGEGVFIDANLLHAARTIDGEACSFFAVDFHYQLLHEDVHSHFARKFIQPVLDGKVVLPELISSSRPDEMGRQEYAAEKNRAWRQDIWGDNVWIWQDKLISEILELRICHEHDPEPFELLIRSHIMEAWDLLDRHGVRVYRGSGEETRASERLEPVIAYMKENYAYEVSLAELAELIPMSEGQFCRVFKQNMKMSPMQYLMRYRIMQSCSLLQNTDKKIAEIANLSGFNNISYYNKVFLQIIGCTPREYRANSNY